MAPLLVARCQACHGLDKVKGKYRLDTFAALRKPGASDEAPIDPGHPEKSNLFQLIASSDPDERMPKKDEPLSAADRSLVEQWIRQGAVFDGPDPAASLASLAGEGSYPAAPRVYPAPVAAAALAFSPDGKRIAVGGYHEVTIWDVADGGLVRRLGGIAQQTQSLAWSPDGKSLAAASGTPGKVGEACLLDPTGERPPVRLDRINDLMMAVAFSPDGSRLAAGGADNAIRVYDIASARRLLLIEQHADWVMDLAYSPDGSQIASASRDKSSRIFDATTGSMEGSYLGHSEAVLAVGWIHDAQRLWTGGRDHKVQVHTAAEGKKGIELTDFGGDVLRIGVCGAKVYVCSADRKVRIYSQNGKELLFTLSDHSDWVYGLAFNEKSGRFATGGFDGEVRIRSLEDGQTITRFIAAPGLPAPSPTTPAPAAP